MSTRRWGEILYHGLPICIIILAIMSFGMMRIEMSRTVEIILVSFGLVSLFGAFIAQHILMQIYWRCPSCKEKLPVYKGKAPGPNLKISNCPACGAPIE